ncbi:ATP-binding protein [Aquabacterium sp.]|uniref:ATP-binding protein n=1 Tax=Aquabacterium sp. TaxID=1872578 RepID=UPI003784D20F
MSRSAPAALHLAGAPRCITPDGHQHLLGTPDGLLLAWLAIEGPTARERLAALLWPESAADAARNALRQRLFRLRRLCDGELVTGNAQQLALAAAVTHDLDDADTVLGTLAPDSDGELQHWLLRERQHRRERQRQRLLVRIGALAAAGDTGPALPLATILLQLDPTREDAHQQLMRLHYLAGDRSAALQAFDHCEQVLKHELGTRPSPETLALLATIEAASPDIAVAPADRNGLCAPTITPQRRTLPAALMRPPRLVGRAHELAWLRRGLAAGGRLLLVGEAGLGKSRLLQALGEGLAAAPLQAAGRPGDALVPYALLARLLRALQQRLPEALAAAAPQQLAPLLPELADEAPAAAGAAPRANLVPAVQAVLRAATAQLPGIVLDDLHFADEATLQLLPALMAQDSAGAWVLALRPPAEGSAQARLLAALSASVPLEPLALQPLDDTALAEMVDSLALPGVSGAQLAPALRTRCGGNPMFALETLKAAWRDGHALEAGALPRPRHLGQLIEAALDALSPPALLLARVAAVAGIDFSIALAAHVLGQHPLQLADAWAELEARQVLRGDGFAHDLVHEAVLAGIPEVLARHSHGTVAQWLEQHAGEPARIAAHWEAAGQRERALPALRAAAARAHTALREAERIGFLLKAADIAEAQAQRDEAFALVAQAIEAHMNTLRDAGGLPLLDRLDRLAGTAAQRARAAGDRAWYCSTQGDWTAAIATGERALALCADVPAAQAALRASLQASISQRLGTALAMAGRFDEALPRLRAAEPWVEAHADSDAASEFQGNLATVLDNLGRPAEAEPYHRRVIRSTAAQGDHAFLATARANLAVSRLNAGDVAGAAKQLALAQQLVTSFELKGASAGFIAALQAQCARSFGRYAAALQWCDEAEALLQPASPGWLPVVHMHRAQALLELGQTARAQQALAACEGAALPPRLQARHGGLRARLLQALGRDSRAALDTALALAPTTGWPELRLTLRIERAACLPAAAAAGELQAVATAADALGLQGVALAARLRLAGCADDAGLAQAAATQALAAPAGIAPNGLYAGERWLGPALAEARAGQPQRAAALAAEGWAWVQDIAARELPEPFRDGFLHRQPINQALRRLLTAA